MEETSQRVGIVEWKYVGLFILVDHDYCVILESLFLRIDILWRWKCYSTLSIDSHYILIALLIYDHPILLVIQLRYESCFED